MALRSRADFIAGLAPVISPLPSGTECSICLEDPTEAVKLQCNHVFDRNCITEYLQNTNQNNSCPNCRQKLFVSPHEEQTLVGSNRHALVGRAVRAAGLAFDQPQHEIETFGVHDVSSTQLQRAIPNAMFYLVETQTPASSIASEPLVLTIRYLGPRIVVMGNLLPHVSALHGRPYDASQLSSWKIIVHALMVALLSRDGEETNALTLPRQLRTDIRERAEEGGKVDPSNVAAFFSTDAHSAAVDDLDMLISYVTTAAVHDFHERVISQRSHERAEEARRRQASLPTRILRGLMDAVRRTRASLMDFLNYAVMPVEHTVSTHGEFVEPMTVNRCVSVKATNSKRPDLAKHSPQDGTQKANTPTRPPLRLATLELREFYQFGIPFNQVWDGRNLSKAVRSATAFLEQRTHYPEATSLLDIKQLNTHTIAMSNLLLRSAEAHGKVYTAQQLSLYSSAVSTIWALFPPRANQTVLASSLASQLQHVVAGHLVRADCEVSTDMRADLTTLIDYLAFTAVDLFAERERIKFKLYEERRRVRAEREPQRRRATRLRDLLPESPQHNTIIAAEFEKIYRSDR